MWFEGREQALVVLVGHHPDHPDQRLERERVLQRRSGRLGAVRVVRGVEHDGRAAPDDLEPARRGDLGERLPDHVVRQRVDAEERLDRRQGDGGVLGLMGAVQRQEHLVVLLPEPAQRDHLAADGGHSRLDAELDALAGNGGSDLGGPVEEYGGRRRLLLRQDRDRTGLDDPGLLDRDHLRGTAQEPGVVDRDRKHHRNRAVGDVGGVPGPAHPDLDHRHVDGGIREGAVGHRDDRLEERQRMVLLGVDQVRVGGDVVERLHERLVGEWLPVDADPFAHPLDMGAGEPTGAEVEGVQQPCRSSSTSRSCRWCPSGG